MSTTVAPTAVELARRSADSRKVRLEGALCVQRGTPMFQAFVKGDLVVRQSKVDKFDPETRRGYQREGVTARMKSAATYYGKGGRMPNPLLMNIREEDFDRVRVEITSSDPAGYERAIKENGDWIGSGYIEFEPDIPLWLYDGQHREGGLEILIARDVDFGSFPVPICLTLGLDDLQELKEFYEVNTNAKSVKTDLAWALLREMAAEDEDLRDLLESKDKDWTIRGIDVGRELQNLGGPWAGRIQEPNQKKSRGDDLVIPQAQFVRSLKPVLDMPLLKRADAKTIANILNAYWQGIQQVLPEPFTKPADYVIQKGQGAIALHRVLPQVIEVVRSKSKGLADPNAYAEVMADLPTLSGEFVEQDGNTVVRSGEDFWRVGSVASGFSGDAGRRRLGILVQTVLPKPSDELVL